MSSLLDELPGLAVGDLVAGKYRLERVLGVGGMGVVLAAEHVALGDKVALKVLHPRMLGNHEAVGRFAREARAAARIKNEHVARVTDVGELESGAPYMVMEYLEGIDLDAWLRERGTMPVEQAVIAVLQVCEALAEAHVLGIVHRDLKPANLFYVDRGEGHFCVKILDFGISKVMEPEADQRLTTVQVLMGSPIYMSPEQMQRRKSVDARSDIWSLGVILFELITRRAPFEAESVAELAVQIATEPPPSVRSLKVGVPVALEKVILRCLEKDRENRYQSVGELAVALGDLVPAVARGSVDRVLATLRAVPGGRVSTPSLDTRWAASLTETVMRIDSDPPPPSKKRSGGFLFVAAFGVLAAVTAASWGVRRSNTAAAALAVDRPLPSSSRAPPPVAAVDASAIGDTVAAASALAVPPPAPVVSTPPAPARTSVAPAPKGRPSSSPPPGKSKGKTTADCDPSYYFDAQGKKHFKPECFAE